METLYIEKPNGSSKFVKFKCQSKRHIGYIAGYVAACKDQGFIVKFNPDSTVYPLLKDAIKRLGR